MVAARTIRWAENDWFSTWHHIVGSISIILYAFASIKLIMALTLSVTSHSLPCLRISLICGKLSTCKSLCWNMTNRSASRVSECFGSMIIRSTVFVLNSVVLVVTYLPHRHETSCIFEFRRLLSVNSTYYFILTNKRQNVSFHQMCMCVDECNIGQLFFRNSELNSRNVSLHQKCTRWLFYQIDQSISAIFWSIYQLNYF